MPDQNDCRKAIINQLFLNSLDAFNREKRKEKERDELWKRLSQLELNHKAKVGSGLCSGSTSTSSSFSPMGSQLSAAGGGGLSSGVAPLVVQRDLNNWNSIYTA